MFLRLTVFGLPADVVAASLDIDPSEVEKISEMVGTLYISFPVIVLPLDLIDPRYHRLRS